METLGLAMQGSQKTSAKSIKPSLPTGFVTKPLMMLANKTAGLDSRLLLDPAEEELSSPDEEIEGPDWEVFGPCDDDEEDLDVGWEMVGYEDIVADQAGKEAGKSVPVASMIPLEGGYEKISRKVKERTKKQKKLVEGDAVTPNSNPPLEVDDLKVSRVVGLPREPDEARWLDTFTRLGDV